jgi:hypothetical protein
VSAHFETRALGRDTLLVPQTAAARAAVRAWAEPFGGDDPLVDGAVFVETSREGFREGVLPDVLAELEALVERVAAGGYVVRFDLVDERGSSTFYAGDAKDGPGFAYSIATARVFAEREVAERWAGNVYGPTFAQAATVVELEVVS